MYDSGLSIGDVAGFFQISRQAMWKIIRRRTKIRPPILTGSNNLSGKKRARWLLRHAIRKGIVKKMPCRECGSVDSQAHHSDYNKPLDVIWLCSKHHHEWHSQNRAIPLKSGR